MATYLKKGDKIVGDKIKCEARKINSPRPINKSGRHKSQRIHISNNAECVTEKETKHNTKKELEKS